MDGTFYEPIEDLLDEFKNEAQIHSIKYESSEIEEIKQVYNQLPVNYEEGQVYVILLCSAISMWFDKYLKKIGLSERKELAIIGQKGNRKSFMCANTIGLFNIKSYDESAFIREYNLNAELKNMYPINLPRFFDEIPGFGNAQKNRKKAIANGTRSYFTKNNMSGGKDYHYDNAIECITANNLESQGDDYDDKQFTYEPEKIDLTTINKPIEVIKKNVSMFQSSPPTEYSLKLGKYIYDELLKIEPKIIMKDIKIPISREDKQFARLEFANVIRKKIGLLPQYSLNKDLFLLSKLSNNSSVETDINKVKNYIFHIISQIEKYKEITVSDFFNEFKEEIEYNKEGFEANLQPRYYNFYNSLQLEGILLRYIPTQDCFEWVLTDKVIHTLKRTAKKIFNEKFQYAQLNNLISLFDKSVYRPRNTIIAKKIRPDRKNNHLNYNFSSERISGYAIPFESLYSSIKILDNSSKKIEESTSDNDTKADNNNK